jgi:hypothetical protein
MNKYLNPKNYLRAGLNKSFSLISPLIKKWEKDKLSYYGNQPLKHLPVFIIGAPRTGSTILYQTLTNLYDILYIDNLACRFNKNLFFGFWLSDMIFKQKAHNNYQADHGSTLKYGLHAPSECGVFWYRWLPTDHHFIDFDEITDEMVEQVRLEISAVINYWDKPLIFKNLNAGQRIRLLSRAFPGAKFVYIKRNPFYTVQSILNARKKCKFSKDKMWSIKPKNYLDLEKLDEISMACGQVYYLEKQIETDAQLCSPDSFFTITYEQMVAGSSSIFRDIANKCEIAERKPFGTFPDVFDDNKIYVSNSVKQKIEAELKKYDW